MSPNPIITANDRRTTNPLGPMVGPLGSRRGKPTALRGLHQRHLVFLTDGDEEMSGFLLLWAFLLLLVAGWRCPFA